MCSGSHRSMNWVGFCFPLACLNYRNCTDLSPALQKSIWPRLGIYPTHPLITTIVYHLLFTEGYHLVPRPPPASGINRTTCY